MRDVFADLDVLHESSRSILTTASELPAVGDPGYVSDSAVGSAEAAAALLQVSVEHAVRAEAVAETLTAAGRRPAVAADAFTALDRNMAGAV